MQRKATEPCTNNKPIGIGVEDSPTIRNLIEQLNRDLEEAQQNASKVK